MIRSIKRGIAHRNMKRRGLTQVNKKRQEYDWKSLFTLRWREYLKG